MLPVVLTAPYTGNGYGAHLGNGRDSLSLRDRMRRRAECRPGSPSQDPVRAFPEAEENESDGPRAARTSAAPDPECFAERGASPVQRIGKDVRHASPPRAEG